MKKNNSILFFLTLVLAAGFTSCIKKVDPVSYSLQVSLKSSGTNFVTTDVTVNPKDSVFFDFSVSSVSDMKYISIEKNGTPVSKDTLTGSANRRTFSAVKKFAADSATGVYTYRILARDSAGVFLGDKNIVVTVSSDFVYYTVRNLFVPDSTAKTSPCYFSTADGKTYSYTTGAANSANIDFGYFYDTTNVTPTTNNPRHTIYALNASTFAPYDLTSWTKNATIFKKITTPTFANITSKGILRTTGITNLASGATTKITSAGTANGNLTGVVIIFKTAAGKYGAMNINYTNQNSAAAGTYINIDVKIEK